MKTCNATAGTQDLKGDARKAFMSALVAGADGLDDLREIVAQAPQHLNAGG